MQITGYIITVAAIGLTIFYFILYHSIFTVFYVKLFDGILKELFGCFFMAILTLALLKIVGGKLISAVGGVLGFILGLLIFLLKIAGIALLIGCIGYLIYLFVGRIRGKDWKSETSGKNVGSNTQKKETNESLQFCSECSSQCGAEEQFCHNCGKKLS